MSYLETETLTNEVDRSKPEGLQKYFSVYLRPRKCTYCRQERYLIRTPEYLCEGSGVCLECFTKWFQCKVKQNEEELKLIWH
jgi:hypothetical protein